MSDDLVRYARIGAWAVPIYAATLFAGTTTHQPPPQSQLGEWSRYVTTNEFLIGHIAFSIFGSVFGAIGAASLGVLLIRRGSVMLGLAGVLTASAVWMVLALRRVTRPSPPAVQSSTLPVRTS